MSITQPFSRLFFKYRILSGFNSLNQFCDELYNYGLQIEPSVLSRWQTDSRTPKDRFIALTLIKIFSDKKSLKNLQEANQILESLQMGWLTDKEINKLELDLSLSIPNIYQKIYQNNHIQKLTDTIDNSLSINSIDRAILNWGKLHHILWNTGKWEKLSKLTDNYKKIDTIPENVFFKKRIYADSAWLSLWQGNSTKTKQEILTLEQISHPLDIDLVRVKSKILMADGKFDLASDNLLQALTYYQEINETKILSDIFTYIGENELMRGNTQQSLIFFTKALQYAKQNQDYSQEAIINSRFGALYLKKENIEKALSYFKASINTAEAIGRKVSGDFYNNLALAIINKQDEIKKNYFYKKAKEEQNKLRIKEGISKLGFFTKIFSDQIQELGYRFS